MIPGEMVIEKVHGLQCTGISLDDRFAMIMAEHRERLLRIRRMAALNNQIMPFRRVRPGIRQLSQRELRLLQQPLQQPLRQQLSMPGLRRFGSDGNLPGLQRSNSFGSFSQLRNRIPWRQSYGSLSRAGSVTNLSQASWHSDESYMQTTKFRPHPRRLRGRGRKQQQVGQLRQQTGRAASVPRGTGARGRGRGRGQRNAVRNQQRPNQQTGGFQSANRNQQKNIVPTKEELDAQLDEYMASSQHVLDKELEEYMLKGAMMEYE